MWYGARVGLYLLNHESDKTQSAIENCGSGKTAYFILPGHDRLGFSEVLHRVSVSLGSGPANFQQYRTQPVRRGYSPGYESDQFISFLTTLVQGAADTFNMLTLVH